MEDQNIVTLVNQKFPGTYPNQDMLVQMLTKMDQDLKTALFDYLSNGTEYTAEIAGYTVSKLMTEWRMNPVAAFSTMASLRKEPEKMTAALKRGYDKVELSQ